jgi:hypothetical protein
MVPWDIEVRPPCTFPTAYHPLPLQRCSIHLLHPAAPSPSCFTTSHASGCAECRGPPAYTIHVHSPPPIIPCRYNAVPSTFCTHTPHTLHRLQAVLRRATPVAARNVEVRPPMPSMCIPHRLSSPAVTTLFHPPSAHTPHTPCIVSKPFYDELHRWLCGTLKSARLCHPLRAPTAHHPLPP